ncbi:unnamed protein product, partial [Meganyctiphanes norvegica]
MNESPPKPISSDITYRYTSPCVTPPTRGIERSPPEAACFDLTAQSLINVILPDSPSLPDDSNIKKKGVYIPKFISISRNVNDILKAIYDRTALKGLWYKTVCIVFLAGYAFEKPYTNAPRLMGYISYSSLTLGSPWFSHPRGMRKAVLIGSCGTMVGAWIKCFSVAPDRFWVTFLGQFITAVSQIFILGIPPRLAAVWFGADQVSTACAVGVFGNQLGVATGFLLPPAIVPASDDKEVVAYWLSFMFYGVACICTVLFIAVIFIFKEKPETPPSAAAALEEETDQGSYFQGIMRLMKNPGYILLLLSYGMNVGAFYAISTLLNQVVLLHFPGEELNAGRIGLVIVLSGMVGSVISGYILDKTAKFKSVTLSVYTLSMVFMLGYTFVFRLHSLWMVFVMASMLGAFMTGYLPVGFEFAAELTYPEAEGTSSGLLNASAQFFGIFCTMADGQLLDSFGDMAANLLLVAVLLVGTIMTACIKEDLRRQAARKKVVPIQANCV